MNYQGRYADWVRYFNVHPELLGEPMTVGKESQ
jgi:hypothetical protein